MPKWGELQHVSPRGATPESMHDLLCEIASARLKFPSNRHSLAALVEEVGETAQAFLQGQGSDRIRAEALQVACVAMRIYEEGDCAFDEGPAAMPRGI